MKVVFAATEEQKKTIEGLAGYFYTAIFPSYFNDDDIDSFQRMGILKIPPPGEDWPKTADDALRLIAALQVLASILETNILFEKDPFTQYLFEKNRNILAEFHISFPFTYSQYAGGKKKAKPFSMYTAAENEYLV
jgi:hypothetical protein